MDTLKNILRIPISTNVSVYYIYIYYIDTIETKALSFNTKIVYYACLEFQKCVLDFESVRLIKAQPLFFHMLSVGKHIH